MTTPAEGREVGPRQQSILVDSQPKIISWPEAAAVAVRRFWNNTRRHVLSPRAWSLGLAHIAIFVVAYWLAFLLRFDFVLSQNATNTLLKSVGWVVALQFVTFYLLGQFHGWWRYVTFADLVALLRAVALSLFVLAVVNFFLHFPSPVPRSVMILNSLLLVALLGGMRSSWRLFREIVRPMLNEGDARWALLVGTDLSNGILAHQIQAHTNLPYRIRGLLSTDGSLPGGRLGQIPILGGIEEVQRIGEAYRVNEVLLVAGTLPGRRLRDLMEACEGAGLKLKIIRPTEDRLAGDEHIPIRDIEINDLLGRDPVTLDTENIGKLLAGRCVMVTGAGGSIGSEICRQILAFRPATLVLVGRGENRIFSIEMELRKRKLATKLCTCIADVTNRDRMEQLFKTYRPEVVFHAAAHKHVPLMEANVGEAIRNNVLGTKCVADLADAYAVQSFVLISTDKAVHPTSVMGATKQLAERYVHTLSQESNTRFTVVRFGNVLGSAGSVVPIFQAQIRHGGPITVTDPRMTRFFMTIPEASQLVLQAATMAAGGIYVLEMGEPVKIVNLARDLIRLSGLPEHAVEIVFTGIRPGEKLYEELYFDDEQTLPTSHPKLRAAFHRPYSLAEVRRAIAQLERVLSEPDEVLRRRLREIVPEFNSWHAEADEQGMPRFLQDPGVKATA